MKKNLGVVIYTGYDLDGICATKIIASILKTDGIQYKIVPVMGYDDLRRRFEDLQDAPKIGSIILINCGAREDLTRQWFL